DDVADLGEVGLGVEVLDPLTQDRRDLFGTKLQKVLLVRSWRRRSSRPRTLASSLIDPAWRTIPPIKSGSTLRVACTLRPDAVSGVASRERSPSTDPTASRGC